MFLRQKSQYCMVSHKPPSKPGLESIALWKGIAPHALERVHGRCRWKSYSEGGEILSYLDRSDDVYFITDGDVRVTIFSLQGSVVGGGLATLLVVVIARTAWPQLARIGPLHTLAPDEHRPAIALATGDVSPP